MSERHLVVIMFMDIVSYTAMMGKDKKRLSIWISFRKVLFRLKDFIIPKE